MIIYRYLAKEIFSTLLAITGLLLLIFLSNQFIRYLAMAAAGQLSLQFVMRIMMLEIPNMLGLLLPLGTFLAIILAFGRMYADSEMTILAACGFSQRSLITCTLAISSVVAFLVAILSLNIGPYISADRVKLLTMGASVSAIDTLIPGRFQTLDNGRQVVYVTSLNRKNNQVKKIFNAEQVPEILPKRQGHDWLILTANQGQVVEHPEIGGRFFVAQQGQRYQGVAGEKDFQVAQFGEYGVKMNFPAMQHNSSDTRGIKTSMLWPVNNKNHSYAAELQWRLSIPLSTLILAFIAVPLSNVKPRKGKYSKVLPAVLILVTYCNMMFVVRNWLRSDFISPFFGFWWLHGLFICLGLLLIYFPRISQHFKLNTLTLLQVKR